jgi:aryl-alcohol dehydrogenase-like predicted oxidoreductase
MKTRQLGTLQVSEISAGAMSISANYGPPADRGEGIKVLGEAHHRGVTFFDTAEVYGPTRARRLSAKHSRPFATVSGSRRNSASTSKAALVV